MKMSRSSIVCMVTTAICALSTYAAATTQHWTRVDVGGAGGQYGGSAIGCTFMAYGLACPLHIDTDTVTSYAGAEAFYGNSNATQPAVACVQFSNSSGGACGASLANNCPSRGVCAYPLSDVSPWNSYFGHFKYIVFENLTQGVLVNGYTVTYNSTI
jgi:hypothetical protein